MSGKMERDGWVVDSRWSEYWKVLMRVMFLEMNMVDARWYVGMLPSVGRPLRLCLVTCS